MKPSDKSPEITKFLEDFFGRSTAIESDTCVTCGLPVTAFRNELSVKEYQISGMCQSCQDSVFGTD